MVHYSDEKRMFITSVDIFYLATLKWENRSITAIQSDELCWSASQTDDEGIDHPVANFSRKLLPREQKYSTIEKERLAIKLGVQVFYVYLFRKPF